MRVIKVRNVQAALPEGLRLLRDEGIRRESRFGDVLVAPEPVCTVYEKPRERVMFWAKRNANPFFHFYESLWMLAGLNDVNSLSTIVDRMSQFSDDGVTFHGAYGHRWRVHFGFDQLQGIALSLTENPDDRRNVLAMWDPAIDFGRAGKDLPCNTHAYFTRSEDGSLDMTVCCRSNDIVWGAYGANAVHFSYLQEYVAAMIGCEVGVYRQISNNYHGYLSTLEPVMDLADFAPDGFKSVFPCPYRRDEVHPFPLVGVSSVKQFNSELNMFTSGEGDAIGINSRFFRRVARPIMQAHDVYKHTSTADRFDVALEILQGVEASDWRRACMEWIERRKAKFMRAADDGPVY